jgi:D-alanyl-D-alanine dipeptidase
MEHNMAPRRTKRRRRQQLVLSGAQWVKQFPTSVSVDDLVSPFRENTKAFLDALQNAGAAVRISATYRPPERAFLMHYAYRIAREGLDPRQVPVRNGIDIDWVHRKANGQVDLVASKNAAEDMVSAYGIVYRPALQSNHTTGNAIDMTISWSGTLSIRDKQGRTVTISGTPRSGQNAQLHTVGKTYGVLKLVSDPPHWSSNGRLR